MAENENEGVNTLGKDILSGQKCPMCLNDTLTLMEEQVEVPFFGKLFVFSMSCSNCKYHKADVETQSENPPAKYTLEIGSEDDMNIRIVKSSEATVKIPHLTTITPGPASNGYVTNVEGILERVKQVIEGMKCDDDDKSERKKIKNMLKKIQNVKWGREKIKLIIEDPSGNSAIISDKAKKEKL